MRNVTRKRVTRRRRIRQNNTEPSQLGVSQCSLPSHFQCLLSSHLTSIPNSILSLSNSHRLRSQLPGKSFLDFSTIFLDFLKSFGLDRGEANCPGKSLIPWKIGGILCCCLCWMENSCWLAWLDKEFLLACLAGWRIPVEQTLRLDGQSDLCSHQSVRVSQG